jgi:hypothetical protein
MTELKLNAKIFESEQRKVNDELLRIDYAIGDLNNNIVATDNYIDKHVPFKI